MTSWLYRVFRYAEFDGYFFFGGGYNLGISKTNFVIFFCEVCFHKGFKNSTHELWYFFNAEHRSMTADTRRVVYTHLS